MKKRLVRQLGKWVNCYLALARKPLNISVCVIEWNAQYSVLLHALSASHSGIAAYLAFAQQRLDLAKNARFLPK